MVSAPETVALVSCGKKKREGACPAGEIYSSTLFRESRKYAEAKSDRWFVLSAKHGLVEPGLVIEPYDETLKEIGAEGRLAWAEKVFQQILRSAKPRSKIIFLAGALYSDRLISMLSAEGFAVEAPLAGLSLGRRVQFLKRANQGLEHRSYLKRFYELIDHLGEGLGGGRTFGISTGKMRWPTRGLYLIFEPGELRATGVGERVVRVGTHAVSAGSKTTLWNRLVTHRGTESGGGSHRSSIFRLHVGAAILSRSGRGAEFRSWGRGQVADADTRQAEAEVEQLVSEHISNMRMLWLDVPDEPSPDSDRAYLERNIIALLTPAGLAAEPPSAAWLGSYSPAETIRCSALWNLNHVGEAFDVKALDILEAYVLSTTSGADAHLRSLAPRGWRRRRQRLANRQLDLFDGPS